MALADARRWTAEGTALLLGAVDKLADDQFAAPSLLPGWTRTQVVAHIAANADALGNLVRWAATGVETPMYRSADDRAAGIAAGAALPVATLRTRARTTAEELADAMDRLTDDQWQAEVRTAQGRIVPATEIPWLRAREVCVHTVDLDAGAGFADLPADFVAQLSTEIRGKRGLAELPAQVAGAAEAEAAAWLTGRPHHITGAPTLGPWL